MLLAIECKRLRCLGRPIEVESFRARFADYRPIVDEVLTTEDGTLEAPVTVTGPIRSSANRYRYAVIRELAKGGLGVVNLALDLDLKRDVALKEIREESADRDEYRARFLREAEITARLEHPGIVPVYAMGFHDDGRPYYVMRLIRGETLKAAIDRLHGRDQPSESSPDATQILARPKPTLHQLVGRLIDASHAIDYAHYRKVMHRDIKPTNIMLGPFGETLVLDWGLAKVFEDGDPSVSLTGARFAENLNRDMPTRIGSKIGTIGYMSPEQALGVFVTPRPTSDIYSLGVTLYQILAGRPPFDGCGEDEFLTRVLRGDYRKPSEIAPGIPPSLEAICLKAMARLPEKRYQTAGELADELERWRVGEPVKAYVEPLRARFDRWSRKHRSWAVGAAMLLVSLSVGFGLLYKIKQDENRLIRSQVEHEIRARQDEENRRQVVEENRDSLRFAQENLIKSHDQTRDVLRQFLGDLRDNPAPDVAAFDRARFQQSVRLVDVLERLLEGQPQSASTSLDLARACLSAAQVGMALGEFTESSRFLDRASAVLTPALNRQLGSPELRQELSRTLAIRTDLHRELGQNRKAEEFNLRNLELLRTRIDVQPHADLPFWELKSRALTQKAAIKLDQLQLEPARQAANQSVELAERITTRAPTNPLHRLRLVEALAVRGECLTLLGDREQAQADFNRMQQVAGDPLPASDQAALAEFRLASAIATARLSTRLFHDRPTEALQSLDQAAQRVETIDPAFLRSLRSRREWARLLLSRVELRLLAQDPSTNAPVTPPIQSDLKRVRNLLDQIRAGSHDQATDFALLGREQLAIARLSLNQQNASEASSRLGQAISHFQKAYSLDPDDHESRKREAIARTWLDGLSTRPAQTLK